MPVLSASRFAAATSLLALVVAAGGTSYAAVKITGNEIAKNAITSKHVKKDKLTGKDVQESSLAKVPSAATADTAATAGKVNGLTPAKVSYRSPEGTPSVVYSGGGLVITASCAGTDLALIATTTKNDGSIYSSLVDLEGGSGSIVSFDTENQEFDAGDSHDLLGGSTQSEEDPGLLTFVYENLDGSVVTGTLATDRNGAPGGFACSVIGTVTGG